MNKYITKILAIATTGIGNLVLYTPVLKVLRKEFPEAEINLLVSNAVAKKLLEGIPLVDEIIVWDKKYWGFIKTIRFLKKIRQKKFDLVITSFLDKSFKVAVFSYLTGAKYRLGFLNKPYGWLYTHHNFIDKQKHEIEYNLDLLRSFGFKLRRREEKKPCLYLEPLEKELAGDFLHKAGVHTKDLLIGIHPGSGTALGLSKRWDRERFAVLADRLIKKYKAKILIMGGKEEKILAQEIVHLMRNKPINVCGEVDIRTTACLIEKCKLFITNDSGLMHIAAAVETPVIAIFGPTLYWKNSPWGEDNVVIRKTLPCSPCYSLREIRCKKPACLDMITVDDVFREVVRKLSELRLL